jgi:DNA-binding MarR family transcriptional regulator
MQGLGLWRNRWLAAGLPVIPIDANRKTPLYAWQTMPSAAQWYAAGGDQFRGNIAVVMGNQNAVIDADEPVSVANLMAWLEGKGIDAPRVRTPSGGVHAYIKIRGEPSNITYALLSPEVGKGELRVSNCYVVAPCSVISNAWYRFEYGNPEKIAAMQAVRWQDLCELLPGKRLSEQISSLPVRLVHREMPGRAARLFELLKDAEQGEPVSEGNIYQSRSEAEAAIVALLALSGWDLSEISQVFEAEQPAHYAALKQREQYLERTYHKALGWIACVPERMQIAALYHQASQQAWQGRGGLLDLAVYQAILAIGYQHATLTPCASERDIAEHAAASKSGVRGGIGRLSKKGYLSKSPDRSILHGASWQISTNPQYATIYHSINNKALTEREQAGCKDNSLDVGMGSNNDAINNKQIDCDIAELWGASCLGRSSHAVYLKLSQDGKSISDLAKQTGKSWATVRSALKRLELHDLAYSHAHLWFVGIGSVPVVAEEFDADQLAARRHARHEREREAWLHTRSRG